MRLKALFAILLLTLPASLWAAKEYNEMTIDRWEGTVMIQHPGEPKPFALETGSTLEKGDVIMVYDKSWVVLRTHRGDKIGLDENTTISVDEFYIGGPDRQIRFILQKGTLFLRTNNCDSKQSFFEVNSGSVVTSVGEAQAVLTYKPEEKEHLVVQYFRGKFSVIDKNNEYKFGVMPKIGSSIKNIRDKENTTDVTQVQLDYIPEWSELNWENGVLIDKIPSTIEEIVNINYKRFYDGEPRLKPSENNILLDEGQKTPHRDR